MALRKEKKSMPFQRWGYTFRGPYPSCDSLQELPGVYVIWCKSGENWIVLDAGEAADVKGELSNHKHVNCWSRNCSGEIFYSAIYTPDRQQSEKIKIIQAIKSSTDIPCAED